MKNPYLPFLSIDLGGGGGLIKKNSLSILKLLKIIKLEEPI